MTNCCISSPRNSLRSSRLLNRNRRPSPAQLLENLESRLLLAGTPLAAPSALVATVKSTTSIQLNWTDNDSRATGYYVLRSSDNSHYSLLAKLTSATAATYTDLTLASGHTYYFQIEAYNATLTSPSSNTATAITSLAAPSGLTVSLQGSSLNLTWKNNDSNATGTQVFRSTDGVNYAPLAKTASLSTYLDNTVAAGKTYYYKVEAVNAVAASVFSNSAYTNTPAPSGKIAITTRYGNELVITATGTSDSILVVQSNSILTITADGQTYTQSAPAAGLFIYTRGGAATINIDKSVTLRTTVETIDGAASLITSAGSNVSAWIDSTDSFTGTGFVHAVASFAGGVSKALGAALANPSDSKSTTSTALSLWGTGPVAGDVNQGSVGDCYFLASLAAFAGQSPAKLMQSAVDMGDGTFTVQLKSTYIRISNQFPVGGFGGFAFAHPGADHTIWALALEKAFCYFRTGANTYASISGGWMSEVYADLNTNSTNINPSAYSESAFYTMLNSELASGKPVTFGTKSSPPNLVGGHAYTLVSVSRDPSGVTHYVVRNPWGVSGDALENSQGYATLTFAQMLANFSAGCEAV